MSDRIGNAAELGARVRERRTELQLTQDDLAAVARVTPRLLSELERGKATAQLDGVLRVVGALGLNLYLEPR